MKIYIEDQSLGETCGKITGTFTVSVTGDVLPMQLIYEGKTPRCLPKDIEFPKEFDVTFPPNHWSNEEKSKQLLGNVIFPHLKKNKHNLGLPGDQKSLLIYDVFIFYYYYFFCKNFT